MFNYWHVETLFDETIKRKIDGDSKRSAIWIAYIFIVYLPFFTICRLQSLIYYRNVHALTHTFNQILKPKILMVRPKV